jgi:hypothetical protein
MKEPEPIPMILHCPECGERHIDGPEFSKAHHTHSCQSCGMTWRPALLPTVGVRFLPGFKSKAPLLSRDVAPDEIDEDPAFWARSHLLSRDVHADEIDEDPDLPTCTYDNPCDWCVANGTRGHIIRVPETDTALCELDPRVR